MKSVLLFIIALLTLLTNLFKIYDNSLLVISLFLAWWFTLYRLGPKYFFVSILYSLLIYKLPNYELTFTIIKNYDTLLKYIPLNARKYVGLFLFNVKSNSTLYESCKDLGITYLVVVSGLHFNFLYKYGYKFLNHYLDDIWSNIIIFALLLGYLFLLNFSISAFRAFLMLLIGCLFKKHLNKIDIFDITLILMVLLNPLIVKEYGFILSFSLTFMIIVISDITKLTTFRLAVISFIASIPIISYLQGSINLLTPLYSYLLCYPYIIAIILSLLCFILPFTSYILVYYFKLLEVISEILSKASLIIHIPVFKPFICILYYLVILFIIYDLERKNRKKITEKSIALFTIIAICLIKPYIENPYEVTFLNVYQGDCICFTSKFSRKAYLVDTGGSKSKDIATTIIIPFLKEKNIKYIDTIVITHDDYDHNGALASLKNNFEVKNVLYSLVSLKIFDYEFKNINTYNFNNDNDNSIVLYGNYHKVSLLLTGDISSLVDPYIIKDYPSLKVDVLKVAHHGSKYSTSDLFLKTYKPKISIISYGYNNYGHPHSEIINKLKNVNSLIYSTFEDGNITIKYQYHSLMLSFSKRKKVQFVLY